MSTRAAATVTIQNRLGLHARPAMTFVEVASQHRASVQVSRGGQTVDGKSIMQMMMLAATQGAELTIEAEGEDADAAIESLCRLVNDKFGED